MDNDIFFVRPQDLRAKLLRGAEALLPAAGSDAVNHSVSGIHTRIPDLAPWFADAHKGRFELSAEDARECELWHSRVGNWMLEASKFQNLVEAANGMLWVSGAGRYHNARSFFEQVIEPAMLRGWSPGRLHRRMWAVMRRAKTIAGGKFIPWHHVATSALLRRQTGKAAIIAAAKTLHQHLGSEGSMATFREARSFLIENRTEVRESIKEIFASMEAQVVELTNYNRARGCSDTEYCLEVKSADGRVGEFIISDEYDNGFIRIRSNICLRKNTAPSVREWIEDKTLSDWANWLQPSPSNLKAIFG